MPNKVLKRAPPRGAPKRKRWANKMKDPDQTAHGILQHIATAIETDVKDILAEKSIKHTVFSFGAHHINPRHFVIIVGVETDAQKLSLTQDELFIHSLKDLLFKHKWPEEARKHVIFDIESEETVSRESNGNWWYHFK